MSLKKDSERKTYRNTHYPASVCELEVLRNDAGSSQLLFPHSVSLLTWGVFSVIPVWFSVIQAMWLSKCLFCKWNAFIKSCTLISECKQHSLWAKASTIYQWQVSWDSEAEDFYCKDICALVFFFFSGNFFYKGVLLGLAILLIPRSSLSVKQYHILTVIVNYFEKIL